MAGHAQPSRRISSRKAPLLALALLLAVEATAAASAFVSSSQPRLPAWGAAPMHSSRQQRQQRAGGGRRGRQQHQQLRMLDDEVNPEVGSLCSRR